MIQAKLNNLIRHDLIAHLVINSIVLTLLLAFIDEGRNDFSWIYDIGSWAALIVYFGIILSLQLLIFKVILRKYENVGKVVSYIAIITSIVLMIYLGTGYNG